MAFGDAETAPGGVGLVFKKDVSNPRFLIVHKMVPGGPAERSGIIGVGDRLVQIDGITLGSTPQDQAPQLPGNHGSKVVLTFERPARESSTFDQGAGMIRYRAELIRSRDYFPDKLAEDPSEGGLQAWDEGSLGGLSNDSRASGWHSSGYDRLMSLAQGHVQPGMMRSSPKVPFPDQSIIAAPPRRREPLQSSVDANNMLTPPRISVISSVPEPISEPEQLRRKQQQLQADELARLKDELIRKGTTSSIPMVMPQTSSAPQASQEHERAVNARIAALQSELAQKKSECEVLKSSLSLEQNRSREMLVKQTDAERRRAQESLLNQAEQLKKERDYTLSEARREQENLEKRNDELKSAVHMLKTERDQLQEALLLKGKDPAYVSLEALKACKMQLENERVTAKQELEALRRDKDVELMYMRNRQNEFHVKTSSAMQALTRDVQEAREERDKARMELEECRALIESTQSLDVKEMREELENAKREAVSSASQARREIQKLEDKLKKAQDAESDATRQRDKLARELVLARAGFPAEMPVSNLPQKEEIRELKEAPKKKLQDYIRPSDPPQLLDALNHAQAREEQRSTPYMVSARPTRSPSPARRDLSPPRTRSSPQPRQDRKAKREVNEAGLDIMRMYLGEETPRPSHEASLARPGAGLRTGGDVALRIEVIQGRHMPFGRDSLGEHFFLVRLGGREVETKRAQKGIDVEWGHTFEMRAPSESVDKDMLTFLLLGTNRRSEEAEHLGYISIPFLRVCTTGQESGWYQIRSPDDRSLFDERGQAAEALLRLTILDRKLSAADATPMQKAGGDGTQVGVLEVGIKRARNFGSVGQGAIDAYVVVQLSGQQRRSGVVPCSDAPEWDEKFTLAVGSATDLVSIMVWDANPDAQEPYVGHIAVPVARVEATGNEDGWYELRDQGGRAVMNASGAPAALLATFKYAQAPEGVDRPTTGWLESESDGTAFFVLDPCTQVVSSYTDPEEAALGARPSLELMARGCSVAPQDGHSFVVRTTDGKQLQLTAATREECDKWVEALNRTSVAPVVGGGRAHGVEDTPQKNHYNMTIPPTPLISLQAAKQKDSEATQERQREVDMKEQEEVSRVLAERKKKELEKLEREREDKIRKQRIAVEEAERRAKQRKMLEDMRKVELEALAAARKELRDREEKLREERRQREARGRHQLEEERDRQREEEELRAMAEIEKELQESQRRERERAVAAERRYTARRDGMAGKARIPSKVEQDVEHEDRGDYSTWQTFKEESDLERESEPATPVARDVAPFLSHEKDVEPQQPPAQPAEQAPPPVVTQAVSKPSAAPSAGQPLQPAETRPTQSLEKQPSGDVDKMAPPGVPTAEKQATERHESSERQAIERQAEKEASDTGGTTGVIQPDKARQDSVAAASKGSLMGQGELSIDQPVALVEAYILKARNLPKAQDGAEVSAFCALQCGSRSVVTQTAAHSSNPVWNQSFQFGVMNPKDDLMTVMLWNSEIKTGKQQNIGHIAVPVQRIAGTGKEEGWYEIRKQDGSVVSGEAGKSAVLISLTYAPAPEGLATVGGWLALLNKDGSGFSRRFVLLDPYVQTLMFYGDGDAASEGRDVLGEMNIRACEVTKAEEAVLKAIESHVSGAPKKEAAARSFCVKAGNDTQVFLCGTDDALAKWTTSLTSIGNPPSLRRLPPPPKAAKPHHKSQETTKDPSPKASPKMPERAAPGKTITKDGAASISPETGSADTNQTPRLGIKVVVDKGRNLPSQESGMLLCIVQLGSSDEQHQTKEVPSAPAIKWGSIFELAAQGPTDLVTIVLLEKAQDGTEKGLGHIAVPVSRIQASGKEEGWYEIRTSAGDIVMGAGGSQKSSLLVRFSILAANPSPRRP